MNLLANGEKSQSQTVTPDASGNWTYKFSDLPVYENGKVISYTVSEEAVSGYTTVVEGTTITNTHTPEITEVSGSKVWDDANNQDGVRPDKITVNLLANGEKVDSKVVTEADNWSYTFKDLPVYKNGSTPQCRSDVTK